MLESAGPVIRYRTASELVDSYPGLDFLKQELLDTPRVSMLLEKAMEFNPGEEMNLVSFNSIHGMGLTLEGIMFRLLEFGVKKGMGPFDEVLSLLGKFIYNKTIQETIKNINDPEAGFGRNYCVAGFVYTLLLLSGDHSEDVLAFMRYLIDNLYDFAKEMSTDIYLSEDELSEYPARSGKWKQKPVIDTRIWKNCFKRKLPGIQDIIGMAAYPEDKIDSKLRNKIDTIIRFIFLDEFQALSESYGLCFNTQRKTYYSLGWRPNLPCFTNFDSLMERRTIVFYVDLMSRFNVACESPWFTRCMEHLEQYRTGNGTYCFPRDYLLNIEKSYYVNGTVMGLCENRRKKDALEIESTFRMMVIKKNAGLI